MEVHLIGESISIRILLNHLKITKDNISSMIILLEELIYDDIKIIVIISILFY
jgi:hypothetical protein